MIQHIQFICPHIDTGGPENIHQVCSCLVKNKFDASIVYLSKQTKHLPKFQVYNNPISEPITNTETLLVIPEYLQMELFSKIKVPKAMFWLSINNSKDFLIGKNIKDEAEKNGFNWHFAQSEYAKLVLEAYGLKNVIYLSDYINLKYFETPIVKTKKPQILYNPKKGLEFTTHIINTNPDLTFIPIENLTVDQVINLMDESMLYIDFGTHPGKDRFPREAALRNCIILTNTNGAAENQKDIPIPIEYKIPQNYTNLSLISKTIHNAIVNYNTEIDKFISYKSFILNEKMIFEKTVVDVFNQVINENKS